MSSFTFQSNNATESELTVHTHVSCQGKHCSYTVGCDCSGFSPKTNGKEWEKSYCKHCGHHNWQGIKAVGYNAKDISVRKGVKVQIREIFARVKLVLDMVINKQPHFLGETIEIK